MNSPETTAGVPGGNPVTRRKVLMNFGLFAIFFIFYLGAALLQTPMLKDVAVIPVGGVPLGLLLSLLIFPVSWLIIIIWFRRAH